jgi:hypothetical protein
MAAVWNIETFPNVDEYEAFTHSLTYSDTDFPSKIYNVVLVASEQNPENVFISGNNVSGYFSDVFNMFVRYKTTAVPNEYINVNNFRKIDLEKLEQVVEYSPDLTPYKVYNYTANVYEVVGNQSTLVTSKPYTKTVNNNWDLNRELLLRYISKTGALDETLFKIWINSINDATVKWKNTANVVVNWN